MFESLFGLPSRSADLIRSSMIFIFSCKQTYSIIFPPSKVVGKIWEDDPPKGGIWTRFPLGGALPFEVVG